MAVFFLLLAMIGGALVGDLIWENTTAGKITVLDRTVTGYPQGWLLVAAAAIGFVIALLLVASVSSTKARRNRRRQFRSMKHDLAAGIVGPPRDGGRCRQAVASPIGAVVRAGEAGPPARGPSSAVTTSSR
jgi:hypothetical protein